MSVTGPSTPTGPSWPTTDPQPTIDATSAAPADGTRAATSASAAATAAATAAPAPPPAPKASDLVPAAILTRYGLDPDKMTTSSEYSGAEWNVGYYPYTGGSGQYQAFHKFQNVFGHGAADAHAYFEFFSNPPGGLQPGSAITRGTIAESSFEIDSGVDISDNRPVSNELYRAMREAGAGSGDEFAVLDATGKPMPFGADDRLVPTEKKDGKLVEVPYSASSPSLVWRIKRGDGSIEASAEAQPYEALLGVDWDTSFDFLDATGAIVPYNPPADRIVQTFEGDDGKWHAFAKLPDGQLEHQVLDKEGKAVESQETIDQAAKDQLVGSHDTLYRVQGSGGELRGDGKVSGSYDMSWWGKCHNVASIGTSDLARPKDTVRVVQNLEAGETLALRFGDHVLKPNDDGTYENQTRDAGGQVLGSATIPAEEAAALATAESATAVIVKADGSLKDAEVTTFTTTDVDALVSHIGDGAVQYLGGAGQRYWEHPDILVTKDGKQIQAHIKEIKTASGETVAIGSRNRTSYNERTRDPLRSPGMQSRELSSGGRSYAFNIQDMAKLNEFREDDIQSFVVIHPDGREETIDAASVELFAWENKFDFRPDQLWGLHETVNENGSTVIERDPGSHVWNYTITGVDTTPVAAADLSAREQEAAARPGMMAGSVGEEGKYFFQTEVNGLEYKYWVRFDDDGDIQDYAYLTDSVPDFVWTQHVRDPYETAWTGESQAPGIGNGEIQRLYLASQGALGASALPGGFISRGDLMTATAVKPETP